MALYKRGNVWWYNFEYKGRRYWGSAGPNKKEAEIVFGKRRVEVREGRFFDVKKEANTKFDALAEEYLKYSRANKKSHRRDKMSINKLRGSFGGKRLEEITPKLIEKYKLLRSEQVKPATVNRELACLKHMFTMALKWGEATSNPVKEVKLFREPKGSLRVLSREEEDKLLVASAPHLSPVIIAALNTGMRKGELLSLAWDRVDLENRVIRIEDTKNGEYRNIPMNQLLFETLKMLDKCSDFVFHRANGEQLVDIRTAFSVAIRRSGIEKCRFHDLRHTFATRLVMAGADLSTVQELLGHKTIAMTMRYSHPTPRHRQWAVELLDLQKKATTVSTTVQRMDNEVSLCNT